MRPNWDHSAGAEQATKSAKVMSRMEALYVRLQAAVSPRRGLLLFANLDDHRNSMELRSQPRLETNEPVHVTVMGESETKFLGRITDYSSRGLGLLADGPAPQGAAVKVEWGDTLLLGEVCYCHPEGEGFAIGLDVEHALYHTEELARLAKRLLDEAEPQKDRREKEIAKQEN
jgi:hypothetical protein